MPTRWVMVYEQDKAGGYNVEQHNSITNALQSAINWIKVEQTGSFYIGKRIDSNLPTLVLRYTHPGSVYWPYSHINDSWWQSLVE